MRVVPVKKGKTKTVRVNGAKKQSVTVTGLSEACAYKVQVRPFATQGKKRVYAKWSAAKKATTAERVYTITYDLDGGAQATGQKTSYKASDKTFDLLAPSRVGFEFVGWFAAGGTEPVTSVASGTKGNLAFVAHWKEVHSYEVTEEVPPTCTEDGLRVETCEWCDKTIETVLPATGHTYKVAEETKPTCITDGKRVYACPFCGDSYEETLPMVSTHALVRRELVEPTCVDEGVQAHWACADCGKLFSDEQGSVETTSADLVIPVVAPHRLVQRAQVEPTCVDPGSLAHWECVDCGKVFSDEQGSVETTPDELALPATGIHHLSLVSAKTATCAAFGMAKHYRCDDCGQLFLDAEGAEPVSVSEIRIARGAHSYRETRRVEATCTASGSAIEKCSVCGLERTKTLPALGHNYLTISHKAAKCTESGNATYRCSRCSKTYTETLHALGHDYDTKTVTSGKDGYICSAGHSFTSPKQVMQLVGSTYKYVNRCPVCGTGNFTRTTATTTTYRYCRRCGDKNY